MTIATPYPAQYPVQPKSLTWEDFLARYGDDPRYELIDGELFDLEPTGPHEEVAALISRKLNVEIDRDNLPYFLPLRCLIKPLGLFTGFRPDVVVLDQMSLAQEPLWQQAPVITLGSSVKFVAEVVSSNWQNDYARKAEDYAVLQIPEYWIVDYAGLGGVDFVGKPKQPTLTLCCLGPDGSYEKRRLRGNDAILSPTFPGLKLTAAQVLAPRE
jgi:Uma2 family endonuclease